MFFRLRSPGMTGELPAPGSYHYPEARVKEALGRFLQGSPAPPIDPDESPPVR
jgi:hypothetical protein